MDGKECAATNQQNFKLRQDFNNYVFKEYFGTVKHNNEWYKKEYSQFSLMQQNDHQIFFFTEKKQKWKFLKNFNFKIAC